MRSWIESTVPEGSDFGINNLPWGVFTNAETSGRICVAIGDHVMDVCEWAQHWNAGHGFGEEFGAEVREALMQTTLNQFLQLGKQHWVSIRNAIRRALLAHNPATSSQGIRLLRVDQVVLVMPVQVGDYTDFYCSKEHATNVGTMFRGKDQALNPNWLHMPIGYHGRASSIVVSGCSLRRPWGQVATAEGPNFQPSQALDYELELACVLGQSTEVGEPIPISQAHRHIFGYCLMNDCSARDIQKWEYVPLGPFNGKNFGTVLSPWIVQHEALEPFLCDAPEQVPAPLPYLQEDSRMTIDIRMRVDIQVDSSSDRVTVSQAAFKDVYWTFPQMLSHHTAGGCNICAGDILASGTISSDGEGAQGCLLELTKNGREPLKLGTGLQRAWLEDGDSVFMSAWCQKGSQRVGFGPCHMTVLPAAACA